VLSSVSSSVFTKILGYYIKRTIEMGRVYSALGTAEIHQELLLGKLNAGFTWEN
jgi:hypothetical protein